MVGGARFSAFLLLNLVLLASPLPQTETTFKVGAWGDDASRTNLGVQVQIETRTYDSQPGSLSYFWVGDDLADGSFIQFGYSLEPGSYCLKGALIGGNFSCFGSSESISSADPRWQWQYWPSRYRPDFYYEIGASGSAGTNGTWHLYTIAPSPLKSWNFMVDGQVVSTSSFPLSYSTDPAFIVAEGGAAANASATLGPVEFRALSYYDGVEWKQVDSLTALSYCGTSVACYANSYGAIAIGSNLILAGSKVPKAADGSLLWTSGYMQLNVDVHPGVQFFVTSAVGTTPYVGNAKVNLPKGMFAYVSLSEPVTSTPGVLGWLGAQDRFQGWVGAVRSDNLTARVLMSSTQSISATWNTDTLAPTIILILATGLAVLFSILYVSRRRPTGRSNRT